jgi:hypothetical protein
VQVLFGEQNKKEKIKKKRKQKKRKWCPKYLDRFSPKIADSFGVAVPIFPKTPLFLEKKKQRKIRRVPRRALSAGHRVQEHMWMFG